MSWWNTVTDFFGFEWVRARDEKGRFVADDKSTPDVDESKKKVYKKRVPRTGYAKPKKASSKKEMLKGDSK
jgi:hypothetical protein